MSAYSDCGKQQKPKISVVLPTYNGSRWLADSIESVLQQTERDWELIIVNDCSADNTLEIAERFARRDPRIKVYSNATNKKLPASLNIGFSHTSGRYRTWTSDDNMFKPNALSTMAAYLDAHPRIDMVTADMDIINEDGTFKEAFELASRRKPEQLSYTSNIGAAFMYRKEIAEKIGGYNEDLFCAEDYDYWCRIALAGTIGYIGDNIYLYRANSQSLTALQRESIREKYTIITNEYKGQFIEKFNLNWWQREKMEYLIDKKKFRKTTLLFLLRRRIVEYSIGALFFWNRKLRRRFRANTSIKL